MTALLRLLAAILTRHIGRDEPPAAEPEHVSVEQPAVVYVHDTGVAMIREIGSYTWEPLNGRPCWVCGNAGGFHTEHECDSHFDTTGGAARRVPAPPPAPLTVLNPDGSPT